MQETVSRMGEKKCIQSFGGESLRKKRQLARPMHRLENYINMNRERRGLEGGDWFYLAQSEEKCTHKNDTSCF